MFDSILEMGVYIGLWIIGVIVTCALTAFTRESRPEPRYGLARSRKERGQRKNRRGRSLPD
jgi:hypothetical protein